MRALAACASPAATETLTNDPANIRAASAAVVADRIL